MTVQALFGLSILLSFVAFGLVTGLFIWPRLRLRFKIQIDPSSLGAAFYIPTVVVPPAMVTHGLIFWLLVRGTRESPRSY